MLSYTPVSGLHFTSFRHTEVQAKRTSTNSISLCGQTVRVYRKDIDERNKLVDEQTVAPGLI